MPDFVHLHNHSEYSLLDGLQKIKNMVSYAKELGMNALAITDHGNMYGTVKFYEACIAEGIKPIIGVEMYIAKRSMHDKEAGVDNDYNHLILLAENNEGYKNLMKLVTLGNLEGFYYKPRIDIATLKKYSDGLICLTACINGYISEPIRQGEEKLAEKRARELLDIFGPENFYFELMRHSKVPDQERINKKLVEYSQQLGVPLVATNDNHYTKKEDAEAQEILLCIQTQTTIETENRKLSMIDSPDFYIKSQEEMSDLFKDIPEAITNSSKIAAMCNVEITLGKWHMPQYAVPDDKTAADYLKELVYEGVKRRYQEVTPKIQERIDYELDIIIKKGYEMYFLVVQDFVNWAKDNGIAVGPGRGSGAGSAVAYSLRITDVDPFFFNLPFERFLNPLRPSAPDFDLDFTDTRREEVVRYVTQKYGEDKVAQIITFGTMEAKGAVRDAGRALGMPYSEPDRISKMIPPGWQGHAMTLNNAIEQSPDLKKAYQTEPGTKRLIDVAKKLEGVARHASVHAAGVVISDKPLTEYVPLQRETNGDKVVTQYDMYTVGEDGVGLLKMDFLGLRNLTIIEEALRFIRENQGIDVDFTKVPIDDKATYDLLSSAETTGIFQLESSGMRRYIKELKPSNIFDLAAMVALYRPGPMQNIPEYITRRHDSSKISLPDPRLKDALAQSYGMLVYQDDVLLTTIALAGYSWLDADKFRKAMGKKIPTEMKKQKDNFIQGAVKNGLSLKKAEEIFELIAPFAGYGFNKAHAACYATIAFRTAYLKAHYPIEFMTALLTAESRGTTGPAKNEKISQAILECKRLKVSVLPPEVNKSGAEFTIEDNTKIRFGLSAIKNVGSAAIESILVARADGDFKSFEDFARRVDLSKVNKKTMESLIKAGAMDVFANRAQLLVDYPEIVAGISKKKKEEKQSSLFGDDTMEQTPQKMTAVDDFSHIEKLSFEKDLLGFYLTSHPYAGALSYIKKHTTHALGTLEEEKDTSNVRIGGIIDTVKKIFTKKTAAEMAFISLSDETGKQIECVVFPRVYEKYKSYLVQDKVVVVDGHIDTKNDKTAVIVDKVFYIDNNLLDLPTN